MSVDATFDQLSASHPAMMCCAFCGALVNLSRQSNACPHGALAYPSSSAMLGPGPSFPVSWPSPAEWVDTGDPYRNEALMIGMAILKASEKFIALDSLEEENAESEPENSPFETTRNRGRGILRF